MSKHWKPCLKKTKTKITTGKKKVPTKHHYNNVLNKNAGSLLFSFCIPR